MNRWCVLLLLGLLAAPVSVQFAPPLSSPQPQSTANQNDPQQGKDKKSSRADVLADTPDEETQITQLAHAVTRLPIAAGLASALAFRPRRGGTPLRQAPVIQTQIILAVVGAVVMLLVGSSLARAFGIVGAAGLVRYRARIADKEKKK